MEIRTLVFYKHLKASTPHYKGWITLCHLEELESLEPTFMSLEEIKKRNDSIYSLDTESCYHHAIHLILENSSEDFQKDEQNLWNEKDKYLSVTRLHLQETTNLGEQTQTLISHFTDFSTKYPDISWRAYQTTELSDLVLVSTSKNFNQLSKWSLLSTNFHLIGKTYTYFCLPYSLLSDETKLNANDSIDYLSLRFSIRNYSMVQKELENVQNIMGINFPSPPHRITGNEDVILYGANIPVTRVISLYKSWYKQGLCILNTFSEVVSRIGVANEDFDGNAAEDWMESELTEYCTALQQRISESFIKLGFTPEWKRPLTVLVNALVYMSRSATLDESVYQILPGLVAFWKNMEDNKLQKDDEELYLRTIEFCVHMMEDLMRAEDQLTRQPEDRPIVYDIPIFFLECVTAFLQALNRLLIEADGDDSKGHRFFLVPCAETDVSTVELFSASKNAPGLLQIDIPFSWLYKPKRLMPALLHESAHYVGEACRLRKKRYDLFLKSACIELVEYFFEPVVGPRETLQSFLYEKLFENDFFAEIQDFPLSEICREIINRVEQLTCQDIFGELVRDYVVDYCGHARFKCPSREELKFFFEGYKRRIDDLRILFRETYADACMFYLVDPKPKDYLDIALDSEKDTLSTSTYFRIYIGLKAAGYEFEEIINAVADRFRNSPAKYDHAKKLLGDLHSFIEEGGNYAEVLLEEYILACHEEFNKAYNSSINRSKIESIYNEMILEKEKFSHMKVLEIIDESRQNILGWLKKTLD